MKKFVNIAALLSLAILSLTGCNKEVEPTNDQNSESSHVVRFVSSFATSKTTMEIGNDNVVRYSWDSEDATTKDWFQVYEGSTPAGDVDAKIDENSNKLLLDAMFDTALPTGEVSFTGIMNGTVQSEQTSCNDETHFYDRNSDVLIAKGTATINQGDEDYFEDVEFSFSRIVAISKMTIKGLPVGAVVENVTVSANADTPLVGKYDVLTSSWSTPESNKIDISCLETVENADEGIVVYFVSRPLANASITVNVMTDGMLYSKTTANAISISAGDVKGYTVRLMPVSSVSLTQEEITAAFSKFSGTSGYGDFTITSGCGDWSGNMYRASTLNFVQVRAKSQAYIDSPVFLQDVKYIVVHTADKTVDGRTFLAVPSDTELPSEDYTVDNFAIRYGESAVTVGKQKEDMKIVFNSDTKQFRLIVLGGAAYIQSIDVFFIPAPVVSVSGISLDYEECSLKVGETATLTPTIAPADATNKNVTWESSNTSVATVTDGLVEAKSVGSAIITVTASDGGYSATCSVTVAETVPASVITYNFNDASAYPSGFPTSGTNVAVAKTFTISGNSLVINAPDSYYTINSTNNSSRGLFFGKTSASNGNPVDGTAYLGFPAIEGKTLTKVVVTTTSGVAGSVKMNIYSTNWSAVSTECTTTSGTKKSFTFDLTNTTANTEYRLASATSAKNLQFDNIILCYDGAEPVAEKETPTIQASDKSNLPVNTAFDVSDLFTSNSGGAFTYTITSNPGNAGSFGADGKTFTATATGSYTISATQDETELYKSATASATITVVSGGATYTKVTDASTLKTGDKIILACDTKNAYAGPMGTNAFLTSVSNKSDAIVITITGNASSCRLSTTEGEIGATADKKMSKTGGTKTWKISIANGDAKITSTENSYGTIQYNASSPRFLNYSSNQTAIQIYRVTGI